MYLIAEILLMVCMAAIGFCGFKTYRAIRYND